MLVLMTLFWRVVAINTALLVVAGLALVLSPATVSATLTVTELAVLAVGIVVVAVVNVALLRRVFGPLEHLAALMRRVEPGEPGRRITLQHPAAEVAELARAFNEMLDRLERERLSSGRRALAAQERERRRLARELHDELGQVLTGVGLQLDGLARQVPPELDSAIAQVQLATRQGIEELREIARGLRPGALEEFGLRSALVTLASGVEERSGIRVRHRLCPETSALSHEQSLAVYRIAQESLTNAARHAHANGAEVIVEHCDGHVVLRIRDDGAGFAADAEPGTGLDGMRERALLIRARLSIEPARPQGTEVRLELPAPTRHRTEPA
jgi:two-component system, NarL family, sensor histidine kinase UhpB